uniref:hypothetical protein n=1 Tax=Iodobacter sp. CM08 TaxID=3085902 RepID=UPI002981086B|nr:hypothetical protein [Iodobacter sp. CM08]
MITSPRIGNNGLAHFLERSASPIVRATVASFGFVYIHPMANGATQTLPHTLNISQKSSTPR